MKRALILGVNGQDGSYLAELLLEKGYSVTGWIPAGIPFSLRNIEPIRERIALVQGDLQDQAGLEACLEQAQPDEIYNLAAPSFPDASWEIPVLAGEVVALGVTRLLEAVRAICPQARLYQASTSELFGNPVEVPQRETTPFHPRNPYGIAKLFAHWTVVNYRDRYGLYAVAGILFNHESPRRGLEFVTRKVARAAACIRLGRARELSLGNLDAHRDWGYAGDYVEAMWKMLQQDTPREFVIGTGETHSVGELCALAFGHVGLDYRQYVHVDPRFYRPDECRQLVADPTLAREQLGWQPRLSFEQLVKLMVEAELADLQSQP